MDVTQDDASQLGIVLMAMRTTDLQVPTPLQA